MDFSYLLELAKANEERNKNDNSVKFSTKVSTAKKLNKPGPKATAVSQVLTRIEEEKKKKDDAYLQKRNDLLALRAKDKHSKKRVHTLINRTKGASKAVLEDAKDLTTAKGEEQCDEDDYGYESAISQQIFSKLQNKYSEMPEDERLKFSRTKKSNIEDIKKRVMSSLRQEQEEDLGIRKRKRKRKSVEEDDGFINDGDEYQKFDHKTEKPKEIKEIKEIKEKSSKSEKKIPANLNTTNYKSDKYSQFKYEKDKKEKVIEKEKEKKKSSKSAPPPMSFEELMKVAQKKQADPLPVVDTILDIVEKKREKSKEIERPLTAKEKKELEEEKMRKLRKMGKLLPEKEALKSKGSKEPLKSTNSKEEEKVYIENKPVPEKPTKNVDRSKYFATSSTVPKPVESFLKPLKSIKDNPKSSKPAPSKAPAAVKLEKPLPPKISKEPKKEKASSRTFPPPYFPRKPAPPPSKKRIDSDDEEDEYDSEMDDFIDDGDAEMDYSSEIAKMFNYDKSKFRDVDDDVDDMEASFSQMQKEERISAKIGLMEDLEDIKREEEEQKKKKTIKKKK